MSVSVDGMARASRSESFWAVLKRAREGTFHEISPKDLNRWVQGLAGRHNARQF